MVDVGGEVGGGGGGEGGAGGSLFSFHVKPGFLRDEGSIGKGVGSLVKFFQNVVKVSFLWGGVGVDEWMSGNISQERKKKRGEKEEGEEEEEEEGLFL